MHFPDRPTADAPGGSNSLSQAAPQRGDDTSPVGTGESAVPPPPTPSSPRLAARKGTVVEVWVRPGDELPQYYRFLGVKPRAQPDAVRWHVDVPTLGFTVSMHRSTFGPWDPSHWEALTETRVPVLVGKWDGTRDELMQKEGLAHDGSAMPTRYFQILQGGHTLPDHFYGRVIPGPMSRGPKPAPQTPRPPFP